MKSAFLGNFRQAIRAVLFCQQRHLLTKVVNFQRFSVSVLNNYFHCVLCSMFYLLALFEDGERLYFIYYRISAWDYVFVKLRVLC